MNGSEVSRAFFCPQRRISNFARTFCARDLYCAFLRLVPEKNAGYHDGCCCTRVREPLYGIHKAALTIDLGCRMNNKGFPPCWVVDVSSLASKDPSLSRAELLRTFLQSSWVRNLFCLILPNFVPLGRMSLSHSPAHARNMTRSTVRCMQTQTLKHDENTLDDHHLSDRPDYRTVKTTYGKL